MNSHCHLLTTSSGDSLQSSECTVPELALPHFGWLCITRSVPITYWITESIPTTPGPITYKLYDLGQPSYLLASVSEVSVPTDKIGVLPCVSQAICEVKWCETADAAWESVLNWLENWLEVNSPSLCQPPPSLNFIAQVLCILRQNGL